MELKEAKSEKYWHGFFEIGLLLKIFNGAWETIIGFLLLFVSQRELGRLFFFLARRELLEDPRDQFLDFLVRALQHWSPGAKTFAAVYILTHGVLNVFLAIQLYRRRLWAYLVTMGATMLFMIYQLHRLFLHGSKILAVITVWDALFIVLTWHEYQRQKARFQDSDKE